MDLLAIPNQRFTFDAIRTVTVLPPLWETGYSSPNRLCAGVGDGLRLYATEALRVGIPGRVTWISEYYMFISGLL